MDILEIFKKVFTLDFIKGFRTYVIGLAMIATPILKAFGVETSFIDELVKILNSGGIEQILTGAGLMTLRAGIENNK